MMNSEAHQKVTTAHLSRLACKRWPGRCNRHQECALRRTSFRFVASSLMLDAGCAQRQLTPLGRPIEWSASST